MKRSDEESPSQSSNDNQEVGNESLEMIVPDNIGNPTGEDWTIFVCSSVAESSNKNAEEGPSERRMSTGFSDRKETIEDLSLCGKEESSKEQDMDWRDVYSSPELEQRRTRSNYRRGLMSHRAKTKIEDDSGLDVKEIDREVPRFTCDLCDTSFKMIESLEDHMKFHVNSERTLPSISVKVGNNSSVPPLVDEIGSSDDVENTHYLSQEGDIKVLVNVNGEELQEAKIKGKEQHMNKVPKIYAILFPLKMKPREDEIEELALQSMNECGICGKSFANPLDLKKHSLEHPRERKYKCDECGKKFLEERHLKAHLLTHSGEKSFQCEQCGKSFGRQDSLRSHAITHTGERDHMCEVCGMTFTHRNVLVVHQLTHGERKHECDICGNSYYSKGSLNRHVKSHARKRFLCKVCNKGFAEERILRDHLTTHTGQRRHKCLICGKSYHMERSLKNHSQSHS